MNWDEAKLIIKNNYECKEDSFIYFLHEKGNFSTQQFWEYYDSVVCLVQCTKERNHKEAMRITNCYESILKFIICHFDPNDLYEISNFPNNYGEYLERLEYAIMVYRTENMKLLDDSTFALQRESKKV
ncbi:MAG: immunity 41 family protein [Eubacterium sp.]|nr:immunity 41 family protein [Eubacterium sp.]